MHEYSGIFLRQPSAFSRLCLGQILKCKLGAFVGLALCCKSYSAMSLGCILEGFYIFDLFYLPSKNQIYIYIYNRPHLRSRATSGRTRFLWEGDLRFAFVREGNGLASRVALMCLLSSCMGLIWMIEQPRQSILEAHRRIDLLWKSIFAYKTSWWMGCFQWPNSQTTLLDM